LEREEGSQLANIVRKSRERKHTRRKNEEELLLLMSRGEMIRRRSQVYETPRHGAIEGKNTRLNCRMIWVQRERGGVEEYR
jgi:hypothetical protein